MKKYKKLILIALKFGVNKIKYQMILFLSVSITSNKLLVLWQNKLYKIWILLSVIKILGISQDINWFNLCTFRYI